MAKMRLSVGEAAELFGITPDAIRYYEKLGLLVPVREAGNNYRYYDLESNNSLHSAVLLRSLGVPIRQMQAFAESGKLRTLMDGLDETEAQIKDELCALCEKQRKLRRLRAQLADVDRDIGQITLRQSPQWWLVSVTKNELDFAKQTKAFHDIMNDKDQLPSYMFQISKDAFLSGERKYSCHGLLLDAPLDDCNYPMEYLEPRQCAYSVFQGTESELVKAYDDLRAWIERYEYHVCGNIIERFIISTAETDFFEIWVPVN